MGIIESLETYLRELQKNVSTCSATEHTHRPALKTLLETFGSGIHAINEPTRIECGAPDFIIIRAKSPIGYIEAKDINISLDTAEKSEQINRYRTSLNNLILTDYLKFIWYVEGEKRESVCLATITRDGKIIRSKDGIQTTANLLERFFIQKTSTIDHPKILSRRMAALAFMLRKLIEETFTREGEEGLLHAQLKAFQDALIPDLNTAQFADMYAQTITYGLFAARLRVTNGQSFSRENAAWNLPKTNPFLRKLFNEIAGPDLDDRIAWIVDDLANLLSHANMRKILKDFGKRTRQEDPVVHFYETFLAAYDPKMRQTRGVYYTPEPVVSFIVRSLDHILKSIFGRHLGLADKNTLILDPALGTATFLYFVIQQIHETLENIGQIGAWNDYVDKHLLPRIFGFELLMAPYAVAHMKLGILLQETGYSFKGNQRLGIYLTNSLEEAITKAETLGFAGFITKEANAAAEIKRERPIMVVLGNPPYAKCSANKGKYIEHLLELYKNSVRHEKNIQPLSDDYIKFIRFAHNRIESTGYGVIGMITNHSYLSGIIHRGMREELMKSFNEIYVLNLHGNSKIGEKTPNGSKDENVFDIQQGVSIILLVKEKDKKGLGHVRYANHWGLKETKYKCLLKTDVKSTKWKELDPVAPYFFFVPKDLNLSIEYEEGWRISDVFPINSCGVKTHRDYLVIDFDRDHLVNRFKDIATSQDEEKLKRDFQIKETNSWTLKEARKSLSLKNIEDYIYSYLYRPYDIRYIFYSDRFIDRDRRSLMHHMLRSDNIGLVANRTTSPESQFSHLFVSRLLIDVRMLPDYGGAPYIFPLYLYLTDKDTEDSLLSMEKGTREPNISSKFIAAIESKLGMKFLPKSQVGLKSTFCPEDIIHYTYAVLHSSTYRDRYAEFLRIDFPRLPLTSDRNLFKALTARGEKLKALHLLESATLNKLITQFPLSGSNKIETVQYTESHKDRMKVKGRVYINNIQYFEGIEPDLWEFQIGGDRVLEKWLNARKGRILSFDDILHYQRIIVALKETLRLMNEIDELIPSWPIK